MQRINALTIAGTDPSGGAGIRADLKTFFRAGRVWLFGHHRAGGAKYLWRTVGVPDRAGLCRRST